MKINRIILISVLSIIIANISYTKNKIDENLLLKMYEEEKMSYDLYTEFYNRWGLEVFNNVRESESVHMQRMLELIEKYDVSVKKFTFEKSNGVYTNKEVQKLYDDYTVKGCISEISALMTAALMEEKDVFELRNRINIQTEEYVIKILTQIEKASINHLIAFVKELKKLSIEYNPKIFSKDEYNSIINFKKEEGIISKLN